MTLEMRPKKEILDSDYVTIMELFGRFESIEDYVKYVRTNEPEKYVPVKNRWEILDL